MSSETKRYRRKSPGRFQAHVRAVVPLSWQVKASTGPEALRTPWWKLQHVGVVSYELGPWPLAPPRRMAVSWKRQASKVLWVTSPHTETLWETTQILDNPRSWG